MCVQILSGGEVQARGLCDVDEGSHGTAHHVWGRKSGPVPRKNKFDADGGGRDGAGCRRRGRKSGPKPRDGEVCLEEDVLRDAWWQAVQFPNMKTWYPQ